MTLRMPSAALVLSLALTLVITFGAADRSAAAPGCFIAPGNIANGAALFNGAGCVTGDCQNVCSNCHDDPGAPCDPAVSGACYPCPHPADPTKGLNKALYGALHSTLQGFVDGNEGMGNASSGELSAAETQQMFQDLGINTPSAIRDVSAYLAFSDPRRYTISGTLYYEGLGSPGDVKACSSETAANATVWFPLPFDTIDYGIQHLLPGDYDVTPIPYGSDPPVRAVIMTFLTPYISDCFLPDCAQPAVCSTEISPVDFHLSADVYCDYASGDDTLAGGSWGTAKKTIRAAMEAARAGDEIWVAAGRYPENITLKPGVALYGGFAGREGAREERDPRVHQTILDGSRRGSVVTIAAGASTGTRIDGFVIQNGNTPFSGGGIQIACGGSASPAIVNNVITGNSAGLTGGAIGIACPDTPRNPIAPAIVNNVITGNQAGLGGGIYAMAAAPLILNNTITGNRATSGAGIYATSGTIANNALLENTSGPSGGGAIYAGPGGGLEIINNTLVGNSSGDLGAAAIEISSSSASVVGNIIAFNTSGLRALNATRAPTLRRNCVYGNRQFDYAGLHPGSGDIQADPQFYDTRKSFDLRLRGTSPCIDAGDDGVVRPGWRDLGGEPRILNAHVDMGADESHRAAVRTLVRQSARGKP